MPGWLVLEVPDGRCDDPQERGLEGGDPDDAGDLARRHVGELSLGCLDSVEQGVGMADQHVTGIGEPDVATDPFEQWRAGLALEHRQLLGDRTRGVARARGRRRGRSRGSALRAGVGVDAGRAFVKHSYTE